MHIHFTPICSAITILLGVIALMSITIVPAYGTSFQLDYDSLQADTSLLSGGNYQLEGGLVTISSILTLETVSLDSSESSEAGSGQGTETSTTSAGGGRRNAPSVNALGPSADVTTVTLHPAPKDDVVLPSPDSSLSLPHQGTEDRTRAPRPISQSKTVLIPESVPRGAASQSSISVARRSLETLSNPPDENVPQPLSSTANALALGSMSLTEAGILARLSWIARIKNLYGTIPAFLS